jgi:hypothetical protein
MTMSEQFNLDRETNIANFIDPAGKKWEIHKKNGQALFHIRPNPDREDAVIPELLQGKWTKVVLLQEARDRYLKLAWDESELQARKNARSNELTKEAAATVTAVEAENQLSNEDLIRIAVAQENAEIAANTE